MRRSLLLLPFLLASALPLSPNARGQAAVADIDFDIESSSPSGKMGQHWRIFRYADPTCESKEKGKKFARKRKGKPIETVEIAAGQPLTLAFWYIEADFGRNIECSYTWTFTPEQGKRYRAELKVSDDMRCSAVVVDEVGADVTFTTPVNSCLVGLYGEKVPNGEPAKITYSVQSAY